MQSINNTDNSQQFSVLHLEKVNLPMKTHGNFELLYVYDGMVQSTIEDKSFEISDGECVLIFPDCSHSFLTYDFSRCLLVSFPSSYVPDFYAQVINLEAVSPVFALKDDIDVLESLSTSDDIYLTKSYLYYLVYKFKTKTSFVSKNEKISNFINIVTNFIQENYASDISLKEISQSLGYDYNYLSSLFNIAFKCNFLYLVNEFRVGKAETLLASGKFSVTDVAFKCGFNSLRTFNRNFLKFKGMSPSQFIQTHKFVK